MINIIIYYLTVNFFDEKTSKKLKIYKVYERQ